MSRLFDFRCRACGTVRIVRPGKHEREPGTIQCSGCRSKEPVSWWRSRSSEPAIVPDTVAMGLGPRESLRFGPSNAELAETGIPNARIRYDHESMQMKEEAPVMNRDAKKQLRLL